MRSQRSRLGLAFLTGLVLPALAQKRSAVAAVFVALLVLPLVAEAQQAGKVWRIGYLTPYSPAARMTQAFRQGLRDYGHVEKQNLHIEFRSADPDDSKFPALAAELVALRPDLLVGQTGPAVAPSRPRPSAKALGLTIPPSVLLRADEVIQ